MMAVADLNPMIVYDCALSINHYVLSIGLSRSESTKKDNYNNLYVYLTHLGVSFP